MAAEKVESAGELNATGAVFPDVSREVPVISLANGRVVDIKVRLDDAVKKGQLMFRVQSPDINNAFDAYLKAVNDEQLANKAYIRAKDLLAHGAVSQAMFEQAENAENNAKADLKAADEQLKLFGVDKDHPSPVVNVYAPTSGVVVAQNIANAGAAGVGLAGSATAFTVADLSQVWVICDVYENDISKLQLGQEAKINVNAYPDRPLERPHQRYRAHSRSFIANRKGAHRGCESRIPKAGHVCNGNVYQPRQEKSMRWFPPMLFFTSMIATGYLCRRAKTSSGARRFVAGQMLSGNRQVILSGIEPGQTGGEQRSDA